MQVSVHWFELRMCPRCPFAAGEEKLRRHVYVEHNESLVGVASSFVSRAAEIHLHFPGLIRVIEIEPPTVRGVLDSAEV